MKIYFAGTTLIREREEYLIKYSCCRLFSYYYNKEDGVAHIDFLIWKEKFFKVKNK